MENKIIKTAQVIADLYNTDDGGVGGYGHIVFDDDNIEKENILWCIEQAKKGEYDYSEETRLASLKALYSCLELNEDEVESAITYYWDKLR
jgi:predicted ThiF/HesA family dinucleotide-utilizing enzyme